MAEKNDSEKKRAVDSEKTEDLDSLLDSALDDFDKLSNESPAATAEKKEDVDPGSNPGETEQIWTDMIKQALEVDPNIRDMFQPGSNDENSFIQDFTKIAEAAAKAMEGETTPSSFAEIMSETMKNLNENSETLQNQFGNPEELANMFQELGLNGAGAGAEGNFEDIPPFMQSIMQSFLSKEILYPSIKEFVDKYPAWLEQHKETISPEQYENYCKQLELMKKIVEEFEAESESDTDDVKKQRFQRIMGHMQQMQSLGHPPVELIGSDVSLDESVMPGLPPGMDPNQCCTM